MAFSANGTSRASITGTNVRIQQPITEKTDISKETKEIWAKAKNYGNETLWFGYILPGLLQSEGVDTTGMSIPEMIEKMGIIWQRKLSDSNPQVSVVMNFSHEDHLLGGYEGEVPTRYCKESSSRVPVQLNALASIGSNDFRAWVMEADILHDSVVPSDIFFGSYPVKHKGEIIKGQFRCILKPKK